METADLIFKIVFVLGVFGVSLVIAMYSTYAERKVAAFFQDRIGPNRAGPFGLLQPLADGVKMFMKEEIIPTHADKALFILGPSIAMLTACMTSVVIPWGSSLIINGKEFVMQITDVNIGILYVFGVVSIGVYGIMIGGWASNNKFSLLGALRASSQMISYELAMGMSIIALVMMTGTLSIREIVESQPGAHWNVFVQPLGFLLFLICAFAETNRTPFDLPECETELVGGYHTEYSSMKLGFYLFAEYINMFISSAIIVCLYFGGYNFPFLNSLGLSHNATAILGTVLMFGKIFFFIFFFMWVRWTIPRFRYDQLMRLGWKILIPLAVLNIVITAVVLLFKYDLWNTSIN
ncbi:MAG: NADH-quinone oxidoreductase subunit NuoH [Bacteroidetes bacterium]|nr:NADH-quinone oxidoreductase subunit NuoH [Bacteroidota bacterium]MBK7969175.1 NADH-quinone oxidoreductase subunit NuoH [Bacteroidota bacterium]MBK8413348.1 NADH-quinone oxidoreductase subunit NuoH [Bacteroidota bacterium]MBK8876658.1 NADH-quinone oxidoreductase subunit NuoH [Bacteroidota bacterium]MBK9046270.1 NADH-quinone oxidoreductase subunit NuoH [Bacteroidota bacterium]